jgi:hypothetical protein
MKQCCRLGRNAAAELWLDAKCWVATRLQLLASTPEAVLSDFEVDLSRLRKGQLANAFWELPYPQHDDIVQWFQSEAIRRIPREAYVSSSDWHKRWRGHQLRRPDTSERIKSDNHYMLLKKSF